MKSTAPANAASPPPRRQPSQARAQHTVNAIFEATAEVLTHEGEEQLSTNRIAERAGVSIGTLYQYFSTREAIVAAMMERHRLTTMTALEQQLSTLKQTSPAARLVLKEFVHMYIQTFAPTEPTMRAVMKLAWKLDNHLVLAHSLREAAERISMWLQQIDHPEVRAPSPALAFVLTRSLSGTVRAAMLEQSSLLDSAMFEAELERVCWAVLSK
jgi:AcrR family transcriptional regulator